MAKFIMSIGNEAFNVLAAEAKNRDVTIQQLLRAVVVPDWIKENLSAQASNSGDPHNTPHILKPSLYKQASDNASYVLVSPAARLRQ